LYKLSELFFFAIVVTLSRTLKNSQDDCEK